MNDVRRFTCEEAFRRLNDYLDHELSAEEMRLFDEHLEVCTLCAREHRFEAALLGGLRERVREVAVPPELVAKVLHFLDANEEPPRT